MTRHFDPTGATGLKPRAQKLLEATDHAGHFAPHLEARYLVKGWLDQGSLSAIVGPPNASKTFLALDLADAVAGDRDWHGTRVCGGKVLYIATEGGAAFANRVAVFDDPRFWVMRASLTLLGKQSDGPPLAEMVDHLKAMHGPFSLIVVDTLARVMGSGDENAAPDIADLLANLDALRERTGANVLLVHHSGKDLTRGARGHSSLKAAIDTEITLTKDEVSGAVTAALTKQRDGPTGLEFTYRLRRVELGEDQDGDPVTSCRIERVAGVSETPATLSGPALEALGQLDGMLGEAGNEAYMDAWRKVFLEAEASGSANMDSRRKAFRRAVDLLHRAGEIAVAGDRVIRQRP